MHSSGLLSQSKKRYRDEVSRLLEQDQQLLRQENERLQAEVRRGREDLLQSRETVTVASKMSRRRSASRLTGPGIFSRPQVRQLDATVLSLKQQQQSQSSPAKALELENAALKRELEAQKERSSVRGVGATCAVLNVPHCLPVLPEGRWRTRTGAAGEPPAGERSAEAADVPTVLAAHRCRDFSPPEHVDFNHVSKRDELMFFQTLQLLPPSPHRNPRAQNRGDDEENAQVRKRLAGFAHTHLLPFRHLSLWFGGHSNQRHLFLDSSCLVDFRLSLGFISAVCPRLVLLFCLHCRVGCLARGASVFLNLTLSVIT